MTLFSPPKWDDIPYAAPNQTVGLFGGTFNPPHDGHALVAEQALTRLDLDAVWWLVTPGNPLKGHSGLPSTQSRVAQINARYRHPQMIATGLESKLGTHYTRDSLMRLLQIRPALNFVFIIGADNLRGLHRWGGWRDIMQMVPIAVIDRPGSTLSTLHSQAAIHFAHARIREEDAHQLPYLRPPAWVFLHGPTSQLSSTLLRSKRAVHGDLP